LLSKQVFQLLNLGILRGDVIILGLILLECNRKLLLEPYFSKTR